MSNRSYMVNEKFSFRGETTMPRFVISRKKKPDKYLILLPSEVRNLRDTLNNWLEWWEVEKDKPVEIVVTAEPTRDLNLIPEPKAFWRKWYGGV